jgi:Cellulose binding domain/Glycosyl hydrolases family 18
MPTPTHRRRRSRTAKLIAAGAAAALAAGGVFLLTAPAHAGGVGAAYSTTSDWSTGYTGQYVVKNDADDELSGWTLEFDLPSGTTVSSLWNGKVARSGDHITVTPEGWNASIPAHGSVTVGFVASAGSGKAAAPTACTINDEKCSVDASPSAPASPSGRPSGPASPTASATATPSPTGSTGSGTAQSAGFAPYVDTSLYPAYDILGTAKATGVKEFTLAFITSGGGCTPKWGGVTDLGGDPVAAKTGELRDAGGDVRVSFGGASGIELGAACSSASDLAAAYGKVIDAYEFTKVDFDIEGAALPDTAANTRRAQAIAQLQKSHSGLDVSFTLPVMPSGLTQDGVNLLTNAAKNGVDVSSVNVMAMDYGSSYTGDMGQYAIDAATATQGQLKSALGLSDAAAWKAVAVTPMIGVNDVNVETFTVADAEQLASFAASRHLGRLSMWSANRDRQCAGGAQGSASPTCSSIEQSALAFTKALGAYGG